MGRFANADGAGQKMPLLRVIVIENRSTPGIGKSIVLEDHDGRRAELAQGAGADGTVDAVTFDRNLISGKQRGFSFYDAMSQTGQPQIV